MMPSIRFANPGVMPMRFAGFTPEAKQQIAASEDDLEALKTLYVKTTRKLMESYRNSRNYRERTSSNSASLSNQGYISQELHVLQLVEVIRLVDHPLILNAVYETIDGFDDAIELGPDHPVTVAIAQKSNELGLPGQAI